MPLSAATSKRLAAIPELTVRQNAPLSQYTRFAIGGPAAILCDAAREDAFAQALSLAREMDLPRIVIGGGTNLVVSDSGFDGVVLRYIGSRISPKDDLLKVESGAVLQDVVDASIRFGLRGLQTMTGIPGFLGGAVYGNAGAYGHSIQELITSVHVTDGMQSLTLTNEECGFRYRDSRFKERKDWVILSAELRFQEGDPAELAATASEIRTIRDKKYPPSMKCAGSIFKNLLAADLAANVLAQVPPHVIREGKIPSAWFLEQTGVKGLRRGDIHVADYHANLIYNDGSGTGADLVAVIEDLKKRVFDRFGFELEEEVQYVGFGPKTALYKRDSSGHLLRPAIRESVAK